MRMSTKKTYKKNQILELNNTMKKSRDGFTVDLIKQRKEMAFENYQVI